MNNEEKNPGKKSRGKTAELEKRVKRAADLLEKHMTEAAYTESPPIELRIAHGLLIGKTELEVLQAAAGLDD